jgi:hypothetical protein
MLTKEEILIKRFFGEAGGYTVLEAIRKHFCDTGCPRDAVDCAYINGRNSVILQLFDILSKEED